MARASDAARVALVIAALAGRAAAEAPPEASSIAVASEAQAAAWRARLPGQRVVVGGGRLTVVDVAGEGRPWLGVVERRGRELWLVGEQFALRLTGPLARPRLAGPGYTIWCSGAVSADGRSLRARRLGVLARPS